jgi:hypothetical protein
MAKADLERRVDETLAAIANILGTSGASKASPEEAEACKSVSPAEKRSTAERSSGLPTLQGKGPLAKSLRELLNPMLQEWVKENLSSLVAELIERELGRNQSFDYPRSEIAPPVQSPGPARGENHQPNGGLIGAMLLNRRMANRSSKMQREEMESPHARVLALDSRL